MERIINESKTQSTKQRKYKKSPGYFSIGNRRTLASLIILKVAVHILKKRTDIKDVFYTRILKVTKF